MQSKFALKDNALNDNRNTIGQRLRHEMKKRGLSAADLARMSDVKVSFLYDVISGKSANPSSVKLARVAEALGVSLTYLAGTSDMPNDGYHFALPSELQDYIAVSRLAVTEGRLSVAGTSGEQAQFHKEWIKKKFGISPADLRLHQVTGDQMQPALLHGDQLLVDTTQKHPSPPGIFLLFDGVGLVAKRLELLGDKLRISCDNPHYSTYESLLEDATIIGRVVWFSREI